DLVENVASPVFMKPVRAGEVRADAVNKVVCLGESGSPVRWASQLGLQQIFDREQNLAVIALNIENGGQGFAEVGFGDFHPDGVDVGAHEVPIPQINAWRRDGSGHHAV